MRADRFSPELSFAQILVSGLTKEEVVAQNILFFLAGYETTATTLSYLIYNLAVYPDIQEKLYEEIMNVTGEEVKGLAQCSAFTCFWQSWIQKWNTSFPDKIMHFGFSGILTRAIFFAGCWLQHPVWDESAGDVLPGITKDVPTSSQACPHTIAQETTNCIFD